MQLIKYTGISKHTKGFTLIELVVVITIMAVLVSLAIPSFNKTIAKQNLKSVAYDKKIEIEELIRESKTLLKRSDGYSIRGTTKQYDQIKEKGISIEPKKTKVNTADYTPPLQIAFNKKGYLGKLKAAGSTYTFEAIPVDIKYEFKSSKTSTYYVLEITKSGKIELNKFQ